MYSDGTPRLTASRHLTVHESKFPGAPGLKKNIHRVNGEVKSDDKYSYGNYLPVGHHFERDSDSEDEEALSVDALGDHDHD